MSAAVSGAEPLKSRSSLASTCSSSVVRVSIRLSTIRNPSYDSVPNGERGGGKQRMSE